MVPKWMKFDAKCTGVIERIITLVSKHAVGHFGTKEQRAIIDAFYWAPLEAETHIRFLDELKYVSDLISTGQSDSIVQSIFWIRLSGLLFEALPNCEAELGRGQQRIDKYPKASEDAKVKFLLMQKVYQDRVTTMKKIRDSFTE